MASMMRLGAVRNLANSFSRTVEKGRRHLNTSSRRNSDAKEAGQNEKKNWITYGFSDQHPFVDRLSMHMTAFTSISICLVFGAVYLTFSPDPKNIEWAQREGYLELRRRESLGLPPIDPYYVHPDKVKLPTDEELGDTEIIV